MAQTLRHFIGLFLKKNNSWKVQLLRDWPTVVGNLHAKLKIVKIHEEHIVLGAYDSVWLHEFYLLSDHLLAKINQSLDKPRIKQLRFILIVPRKNTIEQLGCNEEKNVAPPRLSDQDHTLLSRICDNQLREALKRYRLRTLLATTTKK